MIFFILTEKGRDLPQSHDKSPYTSRNVKRASDNKNNAKKFDYTAVADRFRTHRIANTSVLSLFCSFYFPKRASGAPLHTLSKSYDDLVGFVCCVLLYLRSSKGGCCSLSDYLSCSCIFCYHEKRKRSGSVL